MSFREREVLWYDLVPYYKDQEQRNTFVTAAVRSCVVSGKMLSGSGGPGYSISREVIEKIDMRHGNKAKAIIDIDDLKALRKAITEMIDTARNFELDDSANQLELITRSTLDPLNL